MIKWVIKTFPGILTFKLIDNILDMDFLTPGLMSALLWILLIILMWKIIKPLVHRLLIITLNSLLGIAALIILNQIGFNIPVVIPTILITGLFGIPGIISLALLDYFSLI